MPRGPKGEKRPADVIGNAVKVMRIATGEEDDALADDGKDKAAVSLGRRGVQQGLRLSTRISDLQSPRRRLPSDGPTEASQAPFRWCPRTEVENDLGAA